MTDDEPLDIGGGWVGQGLICKKCGFQTLSVELYTPIDQPCPSCGKQFAGMPDEDDDICDDCFRVNLEAWVRGLSDV